MGMAATQQALAAGFVQLVDRHVVDRASGARMVALASERASDAFDRNRRRDRPPIALDRFSRRRACGRGVVLVCGRPTVAPRTTSPHVDWRGELLSVNDAVKVDVASHIRSHPAAYEAFIGPSLTDPEARAFLESHPDG